jgi:membrane protein YqaA with SNARE-associated domain
MLRSIYTRTMALAGGPKAEPTLAAVSFAESSFFPLPPDLLLGPMAAARPENWLRYAITCTVASVLGGLAGYAIGFFLAESVGRWIVQAYHLTHGIESFREAYAKWGVWIILIKGLTPIPYKLVTIASGMAAFNLPIFVLASIVTRGLRFTLVAWLFQKYGPSIAPVIEKRIGLVMAGIAAVIIVGVIAVVLIH